MKLLSIVFFLVALVAAVFATGDDKSLGTSARCRQPINRGSTSCKEDLDRYGFDTNKNECIRFTYTGCDGNSNRFDTLADCKATCS